MMRSRSAVRRRGALAGPAITAVLALATGALPAASAQQARDLPPAPGRTIPPRAEVLGCATPCTLGVISASNPFYDVFLSCSNGAFTARTGAAHSVTTLAGTPQNVIFGGSAGSPSTSDVSWRFHDQGATYLNPGGGAACVFDPPDTPAEPASVGLEQEWTVFPAPGITCTLREEMVAFGTTEANSGVRMTLATANSPGSSAPVNVGVRWQIDYQNGGDDGPLFATVTCSPPVVDAEWSVEHELAASEIRDFYRIQNNSGFPVFSNVTSTTPIVGVTDTSTPDRLVFGNWGPMAGSAWDYLVNEGGCCPDFDSAVLWYHGYLPADGDVLAPGRSSRHTIVIFSSAGSVDCGGFTPGCATSITAIPPDQRICLGGSALLDASGIALSDCAGVTDTTWTDGTNRWTGAVQSVSPAQTTTYDVAVTCSSDPGCRADFAVQVVVDQPPIFMPPIAADPDACNRGILLSWNPATFLGPGGTGTYNVYRSEISCADALAMPAVATGLAAARFADSATQAGRGYYYVVEAEDSTVGTACTPAGPGNGGSVTRLCAPLAVDAADDPEPAGVGAALRLSHRGDQVTLDWSRARPLAATEHFHVLQAWTAPATTFVRVSSEGARWTSSSQTDRSSWLQFFDVRAAGPCERQSAAE